MKEIRNESYKGREESSYKIFQRFTKYYDNGKCDASGIIGKECYKLWVKSRKYPPKSPHEAFRRAVTAHIRGNDGRRPFSEAAERSLLKELRKKKQWDAFSGTEHLVGVKGFTSLGHHEKLRKGLNPQTNKRKVAAMKKREALNAKRKRSNMSDYQRYTQKTKSMKLHMARPATTPSVQPIQPVHNTSYAFYPHKKHEDVMLPMRDQKLLKSEIGLKAEDIFDSVHTDPAYHFANDYLQDPILEESCAHNVPFCTECSDTAALDDVVSLQGSLDELFGDFDWRLEPRSIVNY